MNLTALMLVIGFSYIAGSPRYDAVDDDDSKGSDACVKRRLSGCVRDLQSLLTSDQHKHLAFASSEHELDTVCGTLHAGIDCVETFIRRCFTSSQRKRYRHLIGGTLEVIDDLCQDGHFRHNFLRHADCFKNASTDYHKCGAHYRNVVRQMGDQQRQYSDDGGMRRACCAYSEFVACSNVRVREDCGAEAALFVTEYTRRAAGPVIQSHCANFRYDMAGCAAVSSASVASSAVTIRTTSLLFFAAILCRCLF